MTTMTETKPRTQIIMMVEDNPQDRVAALRSFEKSGMKNPIVQCESGDEALDYLFRRGQYSDPETSPLPSVILLDLNMPGTDGHEVLEQLKADPELKKIPVIVLTTSSDERDIDRCYAAGANSYVQKPVDLDGFMKAVARLKEYWFEIAILPRPSDDN